MRILTIITYFGLTLIAAAQNAPNYDPAALAVKAGAIIDGSNWDDQDVANAYTSYTGKRVLLSSATKDLEIRFYQQGPLTNAQAAILLEKILGMEGYAVVPSGDNEVKLVPKTSGKTTNALEEFEGIIDNPQDIPKGDEFITYFMSLSYIKPAEAIRIFEQSIHGLGLGTKVAPIPNASAVIISGRSSFVRKLINQKHYIDVAAGNVSTLWVSLLYADAEEVATALNKIMNTHQQRETTASVTTSNVVDATTPSETNTNTTGDDSGAGETIPVQIVANSRLNKIFIMGRPVDVVFVEGLVREFDTPTSKNNFFKRKLRFMIASDFLDVAAKALEAAAGPSSSQQSGSSAGNRRQQSRNTGSGNNRGRSGSAGGSGESVQEFNVSDVPESIVVGKTLLVADNLSNSILIKGPPESLRIVAELIDKLDGRPQQVMISTVFGQITLDGTRDVGVNFGALIDDNNTDVAGDTNTGIAPFPELASLTTASGLVAASTAGLNVYGQFENIVGMIRALESKSDFKVISRPTVYTANNRKAIISSGRRIAVPTNTFTGGGVGGINQSTNIEFRDVLLRFEVVPLINSDDEVTLRISLLNEDTQGAQIIDGNLIPTIVTESITTTVSVRNGMTVVLGGLLDRKSVV